MQEELCNVGKSVIRFRMLFMAMFVSISTAKTVKYEQKIKL